MSRIFIPSARIPSAMSRFDNIKKPRPAGEKLRLALQDKKIAALLEARADSLRENRERLFKKSHPEVTGMNVARIKRVKNQGKEIVYNIAGIGDVVGDLAHAKEVAKADKRTHYRMGAVFAPLK